MFDFDNEINIGDFEYKTMSDKGLETVKKFEEKFINLKPKHNILLRLLGERNNVDAIEFA